MRDRLAAGTAATTLPSGRIMHDDACLCPESPLRTRSQRRDLLVVRVRRSKNQPFCDGSHKGSEFSPCQFTLSETQKAWLCGCKQTGSPPYCNGTHKKL